jgi:hypothetical protein
MVTSVLKPGGDWDELVALVGHVGAHFDTFISAYGGASAQASAPKADSIVYGNLLKLSESK